MGSAGIQKQQRKKEKQGERAPPAPASAALEYYVSDDGAMSFLRPEDMAYRSARADALLPLTIAHASRGQRHRSRRRSRGKQRPGFADFPRTPVDRLHRRFCWWAWRTLGLSYDGQAIVWAWVEIESRGGWKDEDPLDEEIEPRDSSPWERAREELAHDLSLDHTKRICQLAGVQRSALAELNKPERWHLLNWVEYCLEAFEQRSR